jgi:hypothetical protein
VTKIDAIFRACTEGVQVLDGHVSVGDEAEEADVITLYDEKITAVTRVRTRHRRPADGTSLDDVPLGSIICYIVD